MFFEVIYYATQLLKAVEPKRNLVWFGIALISVTCVSISLGSDWWLQRSNRSQNETTMVNQGLWMICKKSMDVTCCAYNELEVPRKIFIYFDSCILSKTLQKF